MTYQPLTKPRAHQRTALTRLRARPGKPSSADVFALLMEMGTGKSKVVLDEFGEREKIGDLDDLLVVAPAGCCAVWGDDRPDQPSQATAHLSADLRKRIVVATWRSGSRPAAAEVKKLLESTGRPRLLVVNVEALSTVAAAREACREFLSRGRAMMVVDESPTIKSWRAARTKVVVELGKLAAARRILSGLPTPNSPLDLYSQFEFLDWRIIGQRSYYGFRARYAVTRQMLVGGYGGKKQRTVQVVVGYRNVEELQKLIAPYSYRVLKEDCLDLPSKTYTQRDVAMTSEQARIYEGLLENATALIEAEVHVTATLVITQMLRLHQLLCGHTVDDQRVVHDVPEKKTAEVVDLIDTTEGKIIVWVPYDHSLRRLAAHLRDRYGEESVACFWGGNKNERADEESRWKRDPACRVMISTQAAGGMGNTWTQAALAIYFANTPSLALRAQSEDRMHRDGLRHAATYVDLVVPRSVDEKFVRMIRSKIDLAATITGDNYREWLI